MRYVPAEKGNRFPPQIGELCEAGSPARSLAGYITASPVRHDPHFHTSQFATAALSTSAAAVQCAAAPHPQSLQGVMDGETRFHLLSRMLKAALAARGMAAPPATAVFPSVIHPNAVPAAAPAAWQQYTFFTLQLGH